MEKEKREIETKKILKKYGDSYILSISSDEIKILGAKLGDIIKIKMEIENE